MTTREERLYQRYNPWRRRILGAVLTLIILPMLTSLDMLFAQDVNKAAFRQDQARSEYQRLRDSAPEYLRGNLLPRVRALAERIAKADASGLDSFRAEVKALQQDIAKLRFALMDRLSRESDGEFTRSTQRTRRNSSVWRPWRPSVEWT